MLFDNFLNIFILLMPYGVGFFVGGDHVMVNCKACIWNEWRRCGKLFCIRPRWSISADTYQASAEKGCVSCLTITEKDGALYPRGPCAGMDICANYQNDMGKLFPPR